jgi:ABC-type sugar transport system ATPase subunit
VNPATPTADTPLLEMQGIEKSFPGVRALRDVDLVLHQGEVLALLGENGAGKSTLIKILGGAHRADRGEIRILGGSASLTSPAAALSAGVGVIYQEFNLVPGLSSWENIFLGRESTALFVRRAAERQRTKEIFEEIGANIPIDTPCGQLSIAQQQMVEIAKALSQEVRIMVMDEPSAALTPREVDKLFAVIHKLRDRGIGVIYISHRLDEISRVADRVMVLRDGQNVAERSMADLTRSTIIEWMVGRTIDDEFPKRSTTIGETRLELKHLCRDPFVRDVSLTIRQGEILGVTGLVGAGRTELARLVFGADPMDGGEVWLDGRRLNVHSPGDAIRAGICLLTEDRKHQGLVLGLSACANFALPNLLVLSTLGWVHHRQERIRFQHYVDTLRIRLPHADQIASHLSGGNQQKVVLAKWLEKSSEVIIFDEPTRGVDVGGKYEIYTLMNELASQGKAIMMISSELPEVLGMSDRVVVMHEGRVTGTIENVGEATQEMLMNLAVG